MTLIVLLILAGVSLSGLFSEKGLFSRTENAGNRYNEAKAREVLETVLLTDGQMEKQTNPKYNQDDFLDDLIKSEIEGSDIKGDVAIIGEYAYELDRSVPKIGHYLGKVTDLIFPAVTVAEITQADPSDNYRTAKIEITATIDEKATNGINRIEIWQNGVKLSTITCNNEKTVTTEYRATKNGVYTIKAYSKISNTEMPNEEISGSARTTVEGIVPAVEFTPNGSTEWKKSHTTTVKVRETAEKVTAMKYLWKKSNESTPIATDFTENCTNNSTITGQGETMTGKYKLWVSVTLGTGEDERTYISGSEEFYFDNEGPVVSEFQAGTYDNGNIPISANITESKTTISKINVYLDNNLVFSKQFEGDAKTFNLSVDVPISSKGTHKVRFESEDAIGNSSIIEKQDNMFVYCWGIYDLNKTPTHYKIVTENTTKEFRNKVNTYRLHRSCAWQSAYGWIAGGTSRYIHTTRSAACTNAEGDSEYNTVELSHYECVVPTSHTINGDMCIITGTFYTATPDEFKVERGSSREGELLSNDKNKYPKDEQVDENWYFLENG